MNEIQGRLLALKEKGWTMAAIADELGVSNMTVFTWQKGTRNAGEFGLAQKDQRERGAPGLSDLNR